MYAAHAAHTPRIPRGMRALSMRIIARHMGHSASVAVLSRTSSLDWHWCMEGVKRRGFHILYVSLYYF